MRRIEVLFSPAEFEALSSRDLSRTTAVVFDVLRATSTIVTALANGAEAVLPVSTIEEALQFRTTRPDVLLAGERDGLRITSKLTGSIDFDLGNSPREFTREIVSGKTIVMTTTNGTRALRAASRAEVVLVASFRNLESIARFIRRQLPDDLLIICSGTHEEASFEDTLGAGALADMIWNTYEQDHMADSAQIARLIYQQARPDLLAAAKLARNGRRLLSIPDLREDVGFCLQTGGADILARMDKEGAVRRWSPDQATA